MEFGYEVWTIGTLAENYYGDKLNLSPPYQRNEIWTKKAQRELIDTIANNQPIPSFFVYKRGENELEMVDGQQRSRSILAFLKGGNKPLTNSNKETIYDCPEFNNYPLNITLITRIEKEEHIELFYALVNRTGLRLNNPELFKAQYYETKFLALITDIVNDDEFKKLDLFRSVKRMNDTDLVSELLALLKYGITDKKEKVEQLFNEDIGSEESKQLKKEFFDIVAVLNKWSKTHTFSKTRYKQKNDLYTLFSLVRGLIGKNKALENIYKWLLIVEPEIYPSQDECEPFKEYAINCVTQSNSKNARTQRLKLIKEILFPNENIKSTEAIMKLYELDHGEYIEADGLTMYNAAIFD